MPLLYILRDRRQFNLTAIERLNRRRDGFNRNEMVALELLAILVRHHAEHVRVGALRDHDADCSKLNNVPIRRRRSVAFGCFDAVMPEGNLDLARLCRMRTTLDRPVPDPLFS